MLGIRDFTTDRLTVRDWRPVLDDARAREWLHAALEEVLTPAVLAPLPKPLQLPEGPDAVAGWVSVQANAQAEAGQVFLISLAADDALIGLVLLAQTDREAGGREIHVGYLLAERYWSRGFASEALRGLVTAVGREGPATMIGGVGTENRSSAHVLTGAGFRRCAELSLPDTDMFIRQVP